MPKTVVLEDFAMRNAEFIELEPITSEPSGRILRSFELTNTFQGKYSFDLYNEVINKKRIRLRLPEESIDLQVDVGSHSSSYIGSLEEASQFNIRVVLTEVDPDLPEKHDLLVAGAHGIIMNQLRIKTLATLLVDAGILTNEQINKRFDELFDKEEETHELRNILVYGVYPEPKKDDSTTESDS